MTLPTLARRALVALGIPAVACSQAPATRHTAADHSAPAEDQTSAGSIVPLVGPADAPTTTEPEPVTTTLVVTTTSPLVVTPTTVRVRATTTTVLVLPENVDNGLSDAEWVGACGGTLPPCWVMRAESGGNPAAVNATGCGGRGCYGKWQFDPRTSRGLGYPLTMDQYPESVQDEAARKLWNGGRGCSHWNAC